MAAAAAAAAAGGREGRGRRGKEDNESEGIYDLFLNARVGGAAAMARMAQRRERLRHERMKLKNRHSKNGDMNSRKKKLSRRLLGQWSNSLAHQQARRRLLSPWNEGGMGGRYAPWALPFGLLRTPTIDSTLLHDA